MKIKPDQVDQSLAVLDRYSILSISKDRRLYLTLARVVRELRQVAEARDQEMNMLLRAFGKQDDKGQLKVPDDKLTEHGKKSYEYLSEPREVDLPGKVKLEVFEAAGIHPTAMELAILDWLILSDETGLLFVSGDGLQ